MDRFIAPSTITDNKVRISSSHVKQTKELLQHPRTKLFFKILDKNLKTGCNIGMIRNEFPNFLLQTVNVALAHSLDKIENAIPFFEGQPSKTKNSEGTDTTSIIPATSLSQHAVKPWFASRKLDGIRCLVGIDRITGGVEVMSRTGKPLECLGPIQTVFERRGLLLQPRTMTAANPSEGTPVTGKKASSQNRLDRFFSIALGNEEISTDQLPEAIFLDGEICVFTSSVEQKLGLTADGAEFGTENFTKAFQFVRGTILRDGREEEDEKDAGDKDDDNDNDDDIESHSANSMKDRTDKVTGSSDSTNAADDRAMYCVFDCLTEKEFRSRIGTRLFSDRIQGFKNALEKFPIHDSFSSLSSEANNSDFIQVLPQTKIESFNQLETMVGRGIELGWEGVMLRKDVGYEGRRSRNLLKIKQFHDAEYKVEDVTLGRMRLPFEGEYIERDQVLTSVVIRHRGNRVGVGSGFSVEDRIRFGRNPSLILGKTITVQYFEESKTKMATVGSLADNNNNQNRDHKDGGSSPRLENNQKTEVGSDNAAPRSWEEEKIETERNVNNGSGLKDVWSLRFPTVKAIYGSGPRQL
ncbi:hypothetical protein BGZ83_011665 [Gryganskiella cystojenkinii]|nr:hypothetical protein BGZ83_011665 [Gryganskiella cystojenkinii]